MYCPECGAENQNNAVYCCECGAVINQSTTEIPDASGQEQYDGNGGGYESTDVYVYDDVYRRVDTYPSASGSFPDRPKQDNKVLAAVIIAAALLISVIILSVVLRSDHKSDTTDTEDDSSSIVTEEHDTPSVQQSGSESEAPSEAPTIEKISVPFSEELIVGASASSFLVEEKYGYSHKPENVLDRDTATAWVENASGNGEGESLTISLAKECLVSGFTISNGYQKSGDTFRKNSRIRQLRVEFSDGSGLTVPLDDYNGEQQVTFIDPVETSSITFRIESVYSGSKYTDTAVSEISLF